MTFSPNGEAKASLLAMLTYARPASSRAEKDFIRAFIKPLGVKQDAAGNLYKRIGTAPVLWSCHTDTVHKIAGRQDVVMVDDRISLASGSKSSCLGADDSAGVWLMSEMILAGVPGLYIFHRGEEIGGIGSRHIARNTPELLDGIAFAIALDRKGQDSVITHQGERCCSDAFARSLAAALGMGFKPDDTGLFTDTANYTDLVGECSNLSVGYEKAHSANEYLDVAFLERLLAKLLTLDIGSLDWERQPGEEDPADDFGPEPDDFTWLPGGGGGYAPQGPMERLIADFPDVAADFFEQMGVDVEEFKAAIRAAGKRP